MPPPISPPRPWVIATPLESRHPTPGFFVALGQALARQGTPVTFLSAARPKTAAPDAETAAVDGPAAGAMATVAYWPSPRPTGLRDIVFAWRLLRRLRPAGVIANFGAVTPLLLAGWLARVPVRIAWYHTLADYDAYNPQLTQRRLRWLNWRRRQVYRLATHVIAVSEAARQDAIHSFGIAPEKCHAIPNAMRDPLEEFPELQQASAGATLLEKGDPHTPSQNFCAFAESAGRRCSSDPANNAGGLPADSAKEQKGLTEGLGTAFPKKGVTNICGLLCVGTLHRAKGQDVLLRTMARLTPAFPELRCVFFGDGPAAVELRQLAVELEVADRCHFAGNRPRLEVLQTMQQAAVVVCPSRSEAFGYVLLEAMALGRPVVAAVAGGIPEIVRDGADGRLFPAGDDQALAETLGEVLSHPDDAVRWGDAGRQRFVQQFTLPARLETVTAWLKQKAAMKS